MAHGIYEKNVGVVDKKGDCDREDALQENSRDASFYLIGDCIEENADMVFSCIGEDSFPDEQCDFKKECSSSSSSSFLPSPPSHVEAATLDDLGTQPRGDCLNGVSADSALSEPYNGHVTPHYDYNINDHNLFNTSSGPRNVHYHTYCTADRILTEFALMSISTTTWNSAGLFCSNVERHNLKVAQVSKLLGKFDITQIQETHDDGLGDALHLAELFRTTHIFFLSPLSSASGGLLFAVKIALLIRIQAYDFSFKSIFEGRASIVSFFGFVCDISCLNVHCDPSLPEAGRLCRIRSFFNFWRPNDMAFFIFTGDLNCVFLNTDRIRICDGRICGVPCAVAAEYESFLSDFTELFQDDFTRVIIKHDVTQTAAKLDRIFFRIPLESYALLQVRTGTIGKYTDPNRPSDHCPVFGSIMRCPPPNIDNPTPPIPHPIATSSVFNNRLQTLIDNAPPPHTNPWKQLDYYKFLAHKARKQTTNILYHRGAATPREKVYFAINALRAVHDLSDNDFTRAIGGAPVLLHPSNPNNETPQLDHPHTTHIRTILGQQLALSDEEYRAEMEAARNLPDYVTDKRRASYLERLAAHSPKRRKLGIRAIIDDNNMPILDNSAACDVVCNYWGRNFQEKPIDDNLARAVLSTHSQRFPECNYIMDEPEFYELTDIYRRSQPGPDGIPYAVYRMCAKMARFLFLCYIQWITTGYLPSDFNVSFLWILPKGTQPSNFFRCSDTRPLSGANTDAKLLAIALAYCFNRTINIWAFKWQRGFIGGRQILHNILDTETTALAASLRGAYPATILFDYRAAFPSLSRRFIWLALYYIGVPEFVIAAIRALYENNEHYINFNGVFRYAFCVYSGVRQGCPLSSTIFILATDCLNRYIHIQLHSDDLFNAFADDTAITVFNIWSIVEQLAEVFDDIEAAACLALNYKKCVIIPLWKGNCDLIRNFVSVLVPKWAQFCVQFSAKYLGFFIGPSAGDSSWSGPLAGYQDICNMIRKLGLPFFSRILLYNMLAVSKLSYIAQLRDVPRYVLIEEARCVRQLFSGVHNAMPIDAIFQGENHKILSASPRSILAMNRASLCRVAFGDNYWRGCARNLREAREHLESFLDFPFPGWFSSTSICALSQVEKLVLSVEDHFERYKVTLRSEDDVHQRNVSIQKSFFKAWLDFGHVFDVQEYLRSRFSCNWIANDLCESAATNFLAAFIACSNAIPPSVQHAWFLAVIYAWPTSRRFQKHDVLCLFDSQCCGGNSCDDLLHYAVCPVVWSFFKYKLRLDYYRRSNLVFLNCDPEITHVQRVLIAVGIFAVYSLSNRFRRDFNASLQYPSCRYDLNEIHAQLWHYVKIAASYHPSVRKVVDSLWALPPPPPLPPSPPPSPLPPPPPLPPPASSPPSSVLASLS